MRIVFSFRRYGFIHEPGLAIRACATLGGLLAKIAPAPRMPIFSKNFTDLAFMVLRVH